MYRRQNNPPENIAISKYPSIFKNPSFPDQKGTMTSPHIFYHNLNEMALLCVGTWKWSEEEREQKITLNVGNKAISFCFF
jgi:hypothetical protein